MPKKIIDDAAVHVAIKSFNGIRPVMLTHTLAVPTETWPAYHGPHGAVGPFDWQTIVRRSKGNNSIAVLGYNYGSVLVGAAHLQVQPGVIQLHHLESSKAQGPWNGHLAPLTMLSMKVASVMLANTVNEQLPLETHIVNVVPGMEEKYVQIADAVSLSATFDYQSRILRFT